MDIKTLSRDLARLTRDPWSLDAKDQQALAGILRLAASALADCDQALGGTAHSFDCIETLAGTLEDELKAAAEPAGCPAH